MKKLSLHARIQLLRQQASVQLDKRRYWPITTTPSGMSSRSHNNVR